MENNTQDIIDKLNHLVALAQDGKEGYANAAEDVKDEEMKTIFSGLSSERGSYSSALRLQIKSLGGTPDKDGGPLGTMHRAWMDIKSTFSSGDKNTIINTCITGEEAAIKAYEEALGETYITGVVRGVISEQLNGIRKAVETIKSHLTASAS